jgi:glutamyl-tRNA reductase
MNIIVVGLSHKTAPVEIREQVAFSPTAMERPLHEMRALPAVTEGIIVSTCNRVELYVTSRDTNTCLGQLKRFLASFHNIPPEQLENHLYDYQGEDAIRHVFRVSSSLDSMVIGEPQILGQIKTAYGYATEFKTVGLILNRFLHKAFSVAKRVRTETDIASNAVSVPFAAVELARKIFGSLDDKKVLLIGAGEMCELAARHFLNNGAQSVMVTNRTYERAVKLAEEFEGQAVPFEEFSQRLHQVDIILTSTGAPDFILGHDRMQEVIRQRKNKPMFLIDIAVPRDIDPKVNKIDNIYLYDVDDLQGVVQANLKERQKEAKKAEIIVDQEIGQFHHWLDNLDVVPTIVALRKKLEDIRQGELQKTFSHLKNLDKKERHAIEALTAAIVNKVLHPPTAVLKQMQNNTSGNDYAEAVRILFALETPTEEDSDLRDPTE